MIRSVRSRRSIAPKALFTIEPGQWDVAPPPSPPAVPKWYRDLPYHLPHVGLEPHVSVKACSPFLDAMMAGYYIKLAADVRLQCRDGEVYVSWRSRVMAETHTHSQVEGWGQGSSVMKWLNDWHLKLPTGYSALFCHPLNDHHLPFRTAAGIVECDVYDRPLNFPFSWVGPDPYDEVLKQGTPIVQVIPFRRENWTLESRPATESELTERQKELSRIVSSSGFYRRHRRIRKRWL